MDKDELKIYLKDNPECIKLILEDMGCKAVRITNKRISSTRPDGDNRGAISVKLNDFLSTDVFTRNKFRSYKIQDFYSLVDYLKGYKLNDALKYIHNMCNLEYTGEYTETYLSESYSFLKCYKRSIKQEEEVYEEILEEEMKEQFIFSPCKLFYDDGINEETQEKFEVGYDPILNRVIFTVRDENGKLLSFKGRTNDKDYRFKGINKYLYYYPFLGERHLYGYYQNLESILKSDEVVIFESEKSVQQCDSFGVNNTLSASKKTLSPYQVNQLIKLGKRVVLAFDKDVTIEEIFAECRKFKGLVTVDYIYDEEGLLDEKDSPSDNGYDIYMKLLENRKQYKGE